MEVDFVDASDLGAVRASIRPNTRLVFTGTCLPDPQDHDLARCRRSPGGGRLPRDRQHVPHPLLPAPFELGCDIVVHSTTKYLDGHNATLGGAVVVNDPELHEKIAFARISAGLVMSPMVAWLTLQE